MRAISGGDLVSSPWDGGLAVAVVRSLNSSAPRLTDFDVGACSSMVRVAINIPAFLLSPFYSYGLGKALRKVYRRRYWLGVAVRAKCGTSGRQPFPGTGQGRTAGSEEDLS